jgi:enoyl-CoA hydratase
VSPASGWLRLEGQLATITLDRPRVLNAIDMGWIRALREATETVSEHPEVRVLVVRGAGRAFCSGLDLGMGAVSETLPNLFSAQETAFREIETLDAITIACIHGYCLGGGLQLAISCDIRICAADATLGMPAVNEGLFPALATYRLPRLIGLGPARRMILSGASVGGDEALRLGLVDYVVPSASFDTEVTPIIEQFTQAPVAAARASKHLMPLAFGSFDDAHAAALPLVAKVAASPDVAAARQRWRSRRAAVHRDG